MIDRFIEFKHHNGSDAFLGVPASDPAAFSRPLALSKVPAGFPSPADDYIESQLDLNEFLVKHPSASFYWKVSGDSMNLAGILDGSILLIDRSLEATPNDIVLATINGDVTVKRYARQSDYYELRPESTHSDYKPLGEKGSESVEKRSRLTLTPFI